MHDTLKPRLPPEFRGVEWAGALGFVYSVEEAAPQDFQFLALIC